MTGSWRVVEEEGLAQVLHAGSVGALETDPTRRQVRVLRPDATTLVLGSGQPDSAWDAAAMRRAGVGITRRRSGGGAVLVGPGELLWVDFVVPAGDRLWDADVGRAAWWVGEAWAAALSAAGVEGAEVWKGPMRPTVWSPVVCFAGLGPGEVTVGGRKVVGVSQRRVAKATLLQTAVLLRWAPPEYLALLTAPPADADPGDLDDAGWGIGPEMGDAVIDTLLEHLARVVP